MNPTSRAALLLLALASPAFLSGCAPAPETAGPAALDPATGTGAIEELVAMMSGSFSSGAQAAEDERFRDIRLQMRRVWPEREDGYWLYVEQAAAGAPGKPYRQRFYRLYESEPG